MTVSVVSLFFFDYVFGKVVAMTSIVDDHLCCDGSDEAYMACPNKCKERAEWAIQEAEKADAYRRKVPYFLLFIHDL
jgi:Glucosidase II beta subunit-like